MLKRSSEHERDAIISQYTQQHSVAIILRCWDAQKSDPRMGLNTGLKPFVYGLVLAAVAGTEQQQGTDTQTSGWLAGEVAAVVATKIAEHRILEDEDRHDGLEIRLSDRQQRNLWKGLDKLAVLPNIGSAEREALDETLSLLASAKPAVVRV